jgi:ABC-type transport system involved in cytochrome c biogenesis permease subunit
MKNWFPLSIAAIFAIWALSALRPPALELGQFATTEFGRLPIVSNGRCQPLDSFARNALLQLREKQSANLEPWKSNSANPKIISASEWLIAMMSNPEVADTWPVIRIDNPDLKGLLGLPVDAELDNQLDGKHFSWNQIKLKLEEVQRETQRAGQVEQSHRTPYDQALLKLWNGVGLYMRIQNSIQPQNAKDWNLELGEFLKNVGPGVAAYSAKEARKPFDQAALDKIMPDLQRIDVMAQLEPPLIIPPLHPESAHDEWVRTPDALVAVARGEQPSFALGSYARMASAYRSGDVSGFNSAVADYRSTLGQNFQVELQKGAREQLFNQLEPFYKAMTIYVLAFVLALGFWSAPDRFELLRRTALALIVVAFAIHTAGLIFRMVLEGRPPVTNLYSSAVFIGWGACLLGMILERVWRNSIGIVVSSTLGFITLIIAHHLSLGSDTMEMMRAVLDTNFWLATHVVVVTLGYASTFVAGFLALIYVIRGVFTPSLDAPTAKSLGKMVYGIICFATLFSFVGTVLGGIWADQSWGRFWGWDVKENGALIIVLWNALILHARWGGMVRERGLMNLAIFGNVVTSWSWFGVNMLGIGLHSYGFMDAGFRWLVFFVSSQMLLIALGSIPQRHWLSFRKAPAVDLEKPLPV